MPFVDHWGHTSCAALSGPLAPSDCTPHAPVRAHPLSYQRREPERDNPEAIDQGCRSQPDRCAGEAREYGWQAEGQVRDGVRNGEQLTALLGGRQARQRPEGSKGRGSEADTRNKGPRASHRKRVNQHAHQGQRRAGCQQDGPDIEDPTGRPGTQDERSQRSGPAQQGDDEPTHEVTAQAEQGNGHRRAEGEVQPTERPAGHHDGDDRVDVGTQTQRESEPWNE